MKNIIVALDNMNKTEALYLAEEIREYIWGVKLNDLIDRYGVDIISEFRKRHIKVFADPKLKDIPNTVRNRIKHYENAGANMVTVMADGGEDMMIAAKESVEICAVIGVTVLTSLSNMDCMSIYHTMPTQKVQELFRDMVSANIDGMVCSPNELKYLYEINSDNHLITITPGIRPEWYTTKDDQKRVSTPYKAIRDGADFLVIGRPITQAKDVLQAAKMTYDEVSELLPL
jgi:orotidine-5'-phosphate decarboxylase